MRPLIHEIYRRTRNGMGYRQVRLALIQEQGLAISRKTVWKLMREEGLFCRIRRKHYNSYKGEVGKMAENLLNRDFQADRPFQKLTTDVTEFALRDGKAYLSPVMDLCGNKIVSWSVKKSNSSKSWTNTSITGTRSATRRRLEGWRRRSTRPSASEFWKRPDSFPHP